MNQKDRQKLKKKCDALWSKVTKIVWIKHHGSMCAWCKIRPGEHSDHIENRWKHGTRWDVSNMIFLCAGCHLFRKKRDPLEWAQLVISILGKELVEEIQFNASREVHNQDYQAIYEHLKSFLPEENKVIGGRA